MNCHALNKKSFSIGLLFILCLVSACKRDPAINVPKPELDRLYGTWEWIRTTGGIGGFSYTPASEGVTRRVEFNANGTYKFFQNNQATEQGYFILTENKTYIAGHTVYFIEYIQPGNEASNGWHPMEFIHFFGHDTLSISQAYISDGFGSVYVRH